MADVLYLFLPAQHPRVCGDELFLIEGVAEAFSGLLHLFVYLLLYLRHIVFNEDVRAVAFLAVLIIYHRVVEGIHMAGSLPHCRVHEDSRVETNDVLVHLHHRFPPVLPDVLLQLHSVLSVVIHGGEPVIDIA